MSARASSKKIRNAKHFGNRFAKLHTSYAFLLPQNFVLSMWLRGWRSDVLRMSADNSEQSAQAPTYGELLQQYDFALEQTLKLEALLDTALDELTRRYSTLESNQKRLADPEMSIARAQGDGASI